MPKFFPIENIKRASGHLQNYNSNWVLVPLVFAVNDVNEATEVSTREEGKPGTDSFFQHHFSGELIGLPAFDNGKNVLRPRFSESMGSLRGPNDWVIHQRSLLWANGYSSRGYRDMVMAKLVSGTGSRFQLLPAFWDEWLNNLPDTFRYSELLTWLYAFEGVPDAINDWDALGAHFQERYLGAGERFQRRYGERFNIVNAGPWPGNFLDERPLNEEYQKELIPSIFETPQLVPREPEAEIEQIADGDPRYLEVTDLLTQGFAGVIFTGPPGTGKTHLANKIGWKLVDGAPDQIRFIQFHASYQYEDFVEGFVPDEERGFKLVPKHLLEVIAEAEKDENKDKLYVIVIDELSRSDPARVFGEALTYIEMSKRTLPFYLSSGKRISIPKNIVFLATMNPQDRGVEEVEQAFERRFAKVRMDPSSETLDQMLRKNGLEEGLRNRLLEFFNFLVRHKNPLARLGHAYFHSVKDEASLRRVWDNQLIFHFERIFQIDSDSLQDVSNRWDKLISPPQVAVVGSEPQVISTEIADPDQADSGADNPTKQA